MTSNGILRHALRKRLTMREPTLLRYENCLTFPVFLGCTLPRQPDASAGGRGISEAPGQLQIILSCGDGLQVRPVSIAGR